jgi:hypothetical protein
METLGRLYMIYGDEAAEVSAIARKKILELPEAK